MVGKRLNGKTTMKNNEAEIKLIEEVAKFKHDPLAYSLFAFPWGEAGDLADDKPLAWQSDMFDELGKQLRSGNQKIRLSVASGHGIGKSAFISQAILWALSTFPDTKIMVTANTDTQLKTKTWPEITKWYNMCINKHWFKMEATSIWCLEDNKKELWRCDRIPWSDQNPQAFAGLHNKKKRIMVVFDEASSISDIIWETIEGAMTDADTEIIWIAFGNPTLNTGRFRECFRKFSNRWITRQIDSRDVEITDKDELQRWVDDYGVDSDFVKVRVRGMFPSSSAKQYINTKDIDAAYGKNLRENEYNFAPIIIGCDPAWEGDDVLTIGYRQGLKATKLLSIPKNDNDIHIANILARYEDELKADAVFVDQGYGTGIVSAGRTMNRNWRLVNSAEKAFDAGCVNKRAEMWQAMRNWLKEGGAIPEDPKLRQQLEAPEAVPRADGKLQIEPKPMIKKRIGESTDEADWLGLTFAYPVASKKVGRNRVSVSAMDL